jgi:pantoate--beta-alanine ligase
VETVTTAEAMRSLGDEWRARGLRIGFVPTMGFLHRGHVSLMQQLRPRCDRLVVSIYVNPLQFGPNEDLDRYPRDPEGDSAKCREAGVDALFMPADIYPSGFATSVHVHGLTDGLCGAKRPGHFEGVVTVCARLFGLTRCHEAIFGEKDWQQLQVVRRMATDLALPVLVSSGELVRDEDGLALSSRNKYLSHEDRARALTLSRALRAMEFAARHGERDVRTLVARGTSLLDVDRLDYLEVCDAESLAPLDLLGDRPARALVAAYVGKTRLIDNMAL